MIELLLSIFKTFPIVDSWIEKLLKAYVAWKIESHDNDFIASMKELKESFSQIKLEQSIGSENAGLPSIQRDGVVQRPRKKE